MGEGHTEVNGVIGRRGLQAVGFEDGILLACYSPINSISSNDALIGGFGGGGGRYDGENPEGSLAVVWQEGR